MKDLLARLTDYNKTGRYPMHMPGHKRNAPPMPNPYTFDITEIEGFDNLHYAEGILKEGMERTAALYGSRQCFHLVNGSTVGLLAGILAAAKRGAEVLIARNCHKAVYHALILDGLKPIYIMPLFEREFSMNGSVSPQQVQILLQQHPNVQLVVVTSPTYEGIVSDISAVAEVCHSKGIPLLVDEAHGAHLGFHPAFPLSAVSQGADLVIQSLHKTLPSLTQTAVLHVCSDRISAAAVQTKLEMLETSSPSYVLMASIERCIGLLQQNREKWFAAWAEELQTFQQKMKALGKFSCLNHVQANAIECFGIDPSKLVISTKNTSFSGEQLADFLRKTENIEPEMISANYVIFMTSLCDTQEGYERLARGILAADAIAEKQQKSEPWAEPVLPVQALLPYEAVMLAGKIQPLAESAGCITKDFITAYPPGIPIAVPGEKLSTEMLAYVEKMRASGVSIQISGKKSGQIEVVLP